MEIRPAVRADVPSVVRIYNDGIASGLTTFETQLRTEADIANWFDARYPFLVAADGGGPALAFAVTGPYSPRACYTGIADFSVYVDAQARRRGLGTAVVRATMDAARERGFHKFVGRVFADNTASLRMLAATGFREVGTHLRHGKAGDVWKDVIVVECLL